MTRCQPTCSNSPLESAVECLGAPATGGTAERAVSTCRNENTTELNINATIQSVIVIIIYYAYIIMHIVYCSLQIAIVLLLIILIIIQSN